MSKNDRKLAHIELTQRSQLKHQLVDERFDYEPMLGHSLSDDANWPVEFLGKKMNYPIWISSMTGGTGKARHINQNLYKIAQKYGLGMGLGSCRPLLDSDEFLEDYKLGSNEERSFPFWANLGIAQVEELLQKREISKIENLVNKVCADGVIVHINPTQEWFQPEGDVIARPPIETLKDLISATQIPVVVKEVGQGFGPRSLKELMCLPLAAIDFAGFGGTSFPKLESLRDNGYLGQHDGLTQVGHTALDMVTTTNKLLSSLGDMAKCQNFIISGGISSYLDGYHLIKKSNGNSVYAMASQFLKHADQGFDQLDNFVKEEIRGLMFAKSYLFVKE
jgi:isopentenyl-diphosphate delta-isomerase